MARDTTHYRREEAGAAAAAFLGVPVGAAIKRCLQVGCLYANRLRSRVCRRCGRRFVRRRARAAKDRSLATKRRHAQEMYAAAVTDLYAATRRMRHWQRQMARLTRKAEEPKSHPIRAIRLPRSEEP